MEAPRKKYKTVTKCFYYSCFVCISMPDFGLVDWKVRPSIVLKNPGPLYHVQVQHGSTTFLNAHQQCEETVSFNLFAQTEK